MSIQAMAIKAGVDPKQLKKIENGETITSALWLSRFMRNFEKDLCDFRKLSKMKTGSNNYTKQKAKIAKLHSHIANQRKDFLHKESRKIANSYDYVAVEDIDMKALSQALHLAKNLLDNGFGMFRKMLEYKLEEQGKVLVKVDKWYASTQICHQCGSKQKIELKERQYICPKCGYEADRDENAAKNLREEGKRILESI